MKQKKGHLAVNVLKPFTTAMLSLNLITITFVIALANAKMESLEENYVTEVAENIASTIETTLYTYESAVQILAGSQTITTLLEQSHKDTPMVQNENISNVLLEISKAKANFQGTVTNISIVDVDEDSYIMDDGNVSTFDTLSTRPYYNAITEKKLSISDPYQHSISGELVISFAYPVFSADNSVLGCVVLYVPTSFLSALTSNFGNTGLTWVVDANNEILAHPNTSYIGQSYTAVGVSGNEFPKNWQTLQDNW